MLKIDVPPKAGPVHGARPLSRFERFKRVRMVKLPKFNSDQQLIILAGGILLLVLAVWRYFSIY